MESEQTEREKRRDREHNDRMNPQWRMEQGRDVRHYRPDGDGFKVTVRVLATRNSYGTDHYLIEPLDGIGQRWTTGARLSPIQS